MSRSEVTANPSLQSCSNQCSDMAHFVSGYSEQYFSGDAEDRMHGNDDFLFRVSSHKFMQVKLMVQPKHKWLAPSGMSLLSLQTFFEEAIAWNSGICIRTVIESSQACRRPSTVLRRIKQSVKKGKQSLTILSMSADSGKTDRGPFKQNPSLPRQQIEIQRSAVHFANPQLVFVEEKALANEIIKAVSNITDKRAPLPLYGGVPFITGIAKAHSRFKFLNFVNGIKTSEIDFHARALEDQMKVGFQVLQFRSQLLQPLYWSCRQES